MAKKNPNELYITRIYDAPVKTVWEAWTDPKQVAQWWGPRGFTLTTHGRDLKPGGFWSYTMHGPDGTDYENKTIYHEVEVNSRLVYDHGGNDDRPPLFRVTVNFTETKGMTKMEMTMTMPTAEIAQETKKFIKKAGGDSTWDRLAEYLGKEIAGKEHFVINRSFNAPLPVLFDMWTKPEYFAQWLPPLGFRMEFLRADIKTGGSTFYFMTNDKDVNMYGRTEYLEIERPDRIIYTQQFCDKDEKLTRHPLAPTWPATILTKVIFTEEDPQQTRVTVTWEPLGAVTPVELATFVQGRAGMTLGWTGSFDKLDNLLEKK